MQWTRWRRFYSERHYVGLVSGGGSRFTVIGVPPNDDRGWYIRIRDPKDEKKTAAVVYLKDDSVSTSGSYEKFFYAEGKLYSHIMDPRTGYMHQRYAFRIGSSA